MSAEGCKLAEDVHLRDLKRAVAAAHVLLALVEAFLVVLVEFLASIQPLEGHPRHLHGPFP